MFLYLRITIYFLIEGVLLVRSNIIDNFKYISNERENDFWNNERRNSFCHEAKEGCQITCNEKKNNIMTNS